MYCAECGSEVKEGLRFCNRCGASQVKEKTAPPRLFTIIVLVGVSIAVVSLIGLAGIFFFAVEIMGQGNVAAGTYVFLVVFTLVVFAIDALLIRQMSKLLSVYLETSAPRAASPHVGSPHVSKGSTQHRDPAGALPDVEATAPDATLHTTASDNPELPTELLPRDEPPTRKFDVE